MTARSSMVSGMAPIPARAAIANVGIDSTRFLAASKRVEAFRGPVALVPGVEQAP